MKYAIKSFIYGIQNLWKWKSVAWNDRWFDHSFLITVIKFKLQDMINNWDNAHYIGSNFTKLRMIVILKRIEAFEDRLDDLLYLYVVHKKFTKEEYKRERRKIISKTWCVLGRNIERFWD